MTDTDDDLIARARKSWHPSDQSGRIVHALCDEIERLVVWSSDSHVTELEARIAELEARNRLMAELINDVLGVAPDRAQSQVWALNLSRSSSVGLPDKFLPLWEVLPDD